MIQDGDIQPKNPSIYTRGHALCPSTDHAVFKLEKEGERDRGSWVHEDNMRYVQYQLECAASMGNRTFWKKMRHTCILLMLMSVN